MLNLSSITIQHRSFYLATVLTVASGLLFTISHAIIRQINNIGPELHPFEIAFFSNLFSIIFYFPIFAKSGIKVLQTSRFRLHLIRSFFNAGSLSAFYAALTLTPLADVVALSLTGPLFVTLGALFFLREIIRVRRWMAILIGGFGAFLIVRPGFEPVNIGMLFVICSVILAAGSKLTAKRLTKTESAITCSAYVAILQTPITFFAALFFWEHPTIMQIGCLILVGLIVAAAHILMVQAFKYVDVSSMEPFTFLRLIWAAIIGLLFFNETPGIWTFAGGVIVVIASSYIARREAQMGKAKATQSLTDV